MNKKACLNILLASSSDDVKSLSEISLVKTINNDLNIEASPEIKGKTYTELEKNAIENETSNVVSSYNTWLRSLLTSLPLFRKNYDKVRVT